MYVRMCVPVYFAEVVMGFAKNFCNSTVWTFVQLLAALDLMPATEAVGHAYLSASNFVSSHVVRFGNPVSCYCILRG